MSLLLEALKRAERAKRQQLPAADSAPIDQAQTSPAPAAAETNDAASEPLFTLDISGLEAFEATQNSLDKPNSSPAEEALLLPPPTEVPALPEPTQELPVTATGNELEFSLEPFDLPPLSPSFHEEKQSQSSTAQALEWSTVDIPAVDEPNAKIDASVSPEVAPSQYPEINTLGFNPGDSARALEEQAAETLPPLPTSDKANSAPSAPAAQADTRLDFALPEDLAIPPRLEPATAPSEQHEKTQGHEPSLNKSTEPAKVEADVLASSPLSDKTFAEKKTAAASTRLDEAREKARRLLGKPAPAVPEQQVGTATGRRTKLLISLLLASIMVGLAGGYYVWQETSATNQPYPSIDTNENAAAVNAADNNAAQAQEASPAPPADTSPAASTLPSDGKLTGKIGDQTAVDTLPSQPQANNAISIVRNPPRIDVLDEAVRQGYAAYDRGDYNGARSQYQRAAKSDPRNRQALLGLAATEEASGNKAVAISLYTQVLSLDPRDHVAQAALLNLSSAEPIQSESRLRLLIAEQPDRAFLHFALGNALAAQSRWPEAEHAYFRATEIDPGNPDYAFNLAISLDQLHQMRPARDHYQRALDLSSRKPARFDREAARQRLEKLSNQP